MNKIQKQKMIEYYNNNFDEADNLTDSEKIAVVQEYLNDEWGNPNGYAVFDLDGSEFDSELLCIERIDEIGLFDSDIDAAKQAQKDGIQLIPCHEYPYRTHPFNCYRFLDTPENRDNLKIVVAKELGYLDTLYEKLRKVYDDSVELYDANNTEEKGLLGWIEIAGDTVPDAINIKLLSMIKEAKLYTTGKVFANNPEYNSWSYFIYAIEQ